MLSDKLTKFLSPMFKLDSARKQLVWVAIGLVGLSWNCFNHPVPIFG